MSTETRVPPATKEAAPKAPPKRSAVEETKEKSHQLRGTIADELVQEVDHFSEPNKQLLKFHGSYQQEDRDARKARHKEGTGKLYNFMVRCKIPGGKLTAKQYLAIDDIAGAHASGTLRFTTRQGIQLHGVLKTQLKETIAGINHCLLSTLGACGDVERNVMACPAPQCQNGVHAQLQETAATLAAHLAPRSRAYHEIWLDGELVSPSPNGKDRGAGDVEPLYGKVYLPRKFKTGLCLPEDNCIDIYAQDLGLLAIVENGTIVGYNVLVGGGMGMTHGNENTFPHLAKPICFVPANAVVGAAEAVVKLFRDHGNRADRKRARIKYLVHDWGVEKFRKVLSEYIGGALHDPRPVEVSDCSTHLGWQPQGNGKWYYGLCIENGRVKDEGTLRLRTGLRTLIERLQPEIRLTPMQDILLCGFDAGTKREIEKTLAEFGILRPDQISTLQKLSMACPALPTCGLALSESERVLPDLIDELETELKRLGLEDEKLTVRMTGCPNGCARPYQSDVGLVGRSGDKYTIFLGGHVLGHRLNFQFKDLVPMKEIVPTLVVLLEHFKKDRRAGECFGDYCQRLGVKKLLALLPQAEKTENVKPHANGEQSVPLPAPEPAPASVLVPVPTLHKMSETFLAGLPREERPDYTLHYNSDGSIRETIVFYYGGDQRAATASAADALVREAAYLGAADPQRLHAARKLSDTYYVGNVAHERRDTRVEYHVDGRVARTVVFFYDGDVRAGQAPSGAAVRRQAVFEGKL